MNEVQKRMLFELEDMLAYYTADVNRRCMARGHCDYNPARIGKEEVSEGCAIGRKMTDYQKKNVGNCMVEDLKEEFIPEAFKGLPMRFLVDLQRLHDDSFNWSVTSMTETGFENANRIKANIRNNKYA